MAFTTPLKSIAVIILAVHTQAAAMAASLGLPTRDQNPMLQAYYLPAIEMRQNDGLYLSHALYITNTFQNKRRGGEAIIIDVENYRYDLTLSYQQENWRMTTTLPFIANERGNLDGLIEDWHDFFSMKQAGRDTNPDNQINLTYIRDGEIVFEQSEPDSDMADMPISLSYRLSNDRQLRTEIGIGIELPTGSVSSNSGNEKIDAALWSTFSKALNNQSRLYAMLGFSLLGKGGQLKAYLRRRIWFSQFGWEYDFSDKIRGIMQLDLHSPTVHNSDLKAFGESRQVQIALQFNQWIPDHSIDLFFSEDILVKSAPDITFGLRLSRVAF